MCAILNWFSCCSFAFVAVMQAICQLYVHVARYAIMVNNVK